VLARTPPKTPPAPAKGIKPGVAIAIKADAGKPINRLAKLQQESKETEKAQGVDAPR
jgi:hypothetical protein